MDERRARIHDDLRDLIDGELNFRPLERAPYAHDASLYEIDPLGVIVPRTEDDVVTAVKYAAEQRIPIHPRGAGTDPAGGSLGPGLVLDLGCHLRRVIAIEPDRVEVQAGVVPDELNALLSTFGRRLEPLPRDSDIATIGGMIAVDAAGGRSSCYGSIGDQVERLGVVFAGGESDELGYEPWPEYESEPTGLRDLIVRKMLNLHRRAGERLARSRPLTRRDRAGYALDRAADDRGIHLGRLVAGSEGTLAVITRAVLRTVELPGAQVVGLLPFGRLWQAADLVPALMGSQKPPCSCDLLDRRSLRLARDADPLLRAAVDEGAEAVLLIEYEAGTPRDAEECMRRAIDRAGRAGSLAGEPATFARRAECERVLGWRRGVERLLMRFRGPARPVSLIDDVAVPTERLSRTLDRLQRLFQEENLSWAFDAHAAEGRLRVRPFLDLSREEQRQALEPLAARVYDIVLSEGGTVSSSSACGLSRTQFLRRQFGDLIQVFREVKDAFDPMGQLNPGKVIGDDPHLMTRNLRRLPPLAPVPASDSSTRLAAVESEGANPGDGSQVIVRSRPVGDESTAVAGSGEHSAVSGSVSSLAPALIWPQLEMLEMAASCHGCGGCRTVDAGLRMCPSFRASRMEESSPRAQANLIRQVATGAVDPRLWGGDELKARADLCIHCKLCKPECPSGVDVSSLMVEAKAAHVERHGLPPGDWVFSRLEMWGRLGTRFPIVSNYLLTRRWARRLLERVLGVSRHRVLPRVRRTPFTRRAARLGLDRPKPQQPGPRVVYFLDVFANYYDQELAEATVAVLRHANVNVYVPRQQRSSGMASLVVGDIEYAREQAQANLRILANAVRDGYTVVCSEPTAALMLREEYVKLTEDLDAELVAAHTLELGQYLLGLAGRGQLPAPQEPLHARVGYHQPCHLRALEIGTPGLELLRSIADLDVEFIDRGCSGMGGTHGLGRRRFRTSLRAGRGLLGRLRETDIDIGATECSACRIQMEQGSVKRTLHPVKLLSLAYGLDPLLRRHFKDPKPRHVMS